MSARSRSNPWWKTERRTATPPAAMTLREAVEFVVEERKAGRPVPDVDWIPNPVPVVYMMPRPNGIIRTLKGDS